MAEGDQAYLGLVDQGQGQSVEVASAELELGGSGSLARRPFDPVCHELDATFRLTKYADLKGWGCKIPQEVLLKVSSFPGSCVN